MHDRHSKSASNSINTWVRNKISYSGLNDLNYVGHIYTWTNDNFGTSHKKARLDLVLGNDLWINNFREARLFHQKFLGSDHFHVLFVTDPSSENL